MSTGSGSIQPVFYMGVDSNGRCVAPRIKPGLPHPFGGHGLAVRIEEATQSFEDPAQVYAYGIRTVLETATHDVRWKQLLNRSEVIADALFRRIGPFAIRDLRRAADAGRFKIPNAELVWRLTSHAIVGISLAVKKGEVPLDSLDQVVVRLLCMTGLSVDGAIELSRRPRPSLRAE